MKSKYYTYKLDMTILNIMAILLFLVVTFIVLVIEHNDTYNISYSFNLIIYVFLWMILHEGLHGVGFSLFSCVDRHNIVFGMSLDMGVFYCMCKQEIPRKVILTSLLFPVVLIGIVTLVIGMIINSYMLVFLSIMNIVGSIGDIVMFIYFIKVGPVRYLDLDDCTSFTVISDRDLSSYSVKGIKLVDSGIYDCKKMYAKDRKKFRVTKLSCVILVIIFILWIICFRGGM